MNDCILTLDIDWAPDFAIDFAAKALFSKNVKATWFVTHASPAVSRLASHPDLFELGIHPNFLSNSTHGKSIEDVLNYCMAIVPDAESMRTHGLVQSSQLWIDILAKTPIRTDCSLLLPHARHLHPVSFDWKKKSIIRIPTYWEDDNEMERSSPMFRLEAYKMNDVGLKVFDFHPAHILLNSNNPGAYAAIKRENPVLSNASTSDFSRYLQQGAGTQILFFEIVDYLAAQNNSACIRDISREALRGIAP